MNTTLEHDTIVLQFYASIAEASGQMLDAARNGDWDTLCLAEKHCASLIGRLQTTYRSTGTDAHSITDSEKRRRIAYIKKILADDAAIRNITEPRLKQLESFLQVSSNSQKLNSTYGYSRP
ncbi:MAG: flagellar protein FliT [Burkholderiaceae bacterium]|jgi:flagellar protein FliT